jgi:hypothetical protein
MHEMYSYPFPEVRETVATPELSPRFMLNTLTLPEAAGLIATYNFQPPLELPANGQNELDLDELHIPVIDRIRTIQSEHMPGLEYFSNAYPTPGSSQSMFTLLAEWQAKGKLNSIAVLNGEYEGYAAYASTLNIPVVRYDSLEGIEPQEDQVWFISNPSAVDGNWIDKDAWKRFTETGHSIVFDAAYVGLTSDGTVDVSSPNIKAVLTSPSKLFGVFRYRNTGITYTREPVASMYGTKWFKDVPALLDTLKLYETFGRNELVHQYRPRQERICQALSQLVDTTIIPSDVLLLGHTAEPLGDEYQRFARHNVHRFGLTKLFEDFENYESE